MAILYKGKEIPFVDICLPFNEVRLELTEKILILERQLKKSPNNEC